MSLITLPEAERAQRDAPQAQALIAEARAHARRRRLKMAAALAVLAVAVAAGVLIGRAVSTHAAVQARPRPAPAAGMGTVTGHLAACFGVVSQNGPLPVTPGTVVVLRGRLIWKPDGPGSWRLVYPQGPAVASEHISNNYDQTFRFALPPGHYVIAGRYDGRPGYGPVNEVKVTPGATIRVDLPNQCQ